MGSTRPSHRTSRSLSGIRTAFAALAMPPPAIAATDFTTMADFSPRLRFCKRVSSTSIIPSKDAGFESQEPTSPKVTCTGQIKRKPHWAKASKREAATTPTEPAKDTSHNMKKLSKLKKLVLGRHHNSDNNRATKDNEDVQVEEGKCILQAWNSDDYRRDLVSSGNMKNKKLWLKNVWCCQKVLELIL